MRAYTYSVEICTKSGQTSYEQGILLSVDADSVLHKIRWLVSTAHKDILWASILELNEASL